MHGAFTQAACIVDMSGHFVNVSPSLEAFLCCDGASLQGKSLLEHLEGAEQVEPLLAEVFGWGARSFQVRLRGPSGLQWVTLRLSPGGLGPEGPRVVACMTCRPDNSQEADGPLAKPWTPFSWPVDSEPDSGR